MQKKNNMDKFFIKNNWCYSLMVAFILSNVIYFTRLCQTGDKGVIRAMIDMDQTIAKLNLDEATF